MIPVLLLYWCEFIPVVFYGYASGYMRVSMGSTVNRKTAKNLAVKRKNERILTVSRYKMLTVKKSNHKSEVFEIFCSV